MHQVFASASPIHDGTPDPRATTGKTGGVMTISTRAAQASRRATIAGVLGLSMLAGLPQAASAEGTIRIAEQFGIGYLPLQMMRDRELIEKHGAEAGLEITVEWARFSGGQAMNEALLSDSVDVGSGGVGPLILIWDRTNGDVKGIAAINDMPLFLNSNDPELQSLEDFTVDHKIAVPAAGVSIQARILQMAAQQQLGAWDALENNQVSLPHPDATAQMISQVAGISAHLTSPPFQYQQLQHDHIHNVLSSYDVLGRHTFNSVWTRSGFREDNPQTYAAFLAALEEAMALIEADPAAAAETYIRVTGSGLDPAFILSMIEDPDIGYTTTPNNTMKFAAFMHEIGVINTLPASWQDYYFDDIHDQPGS
jgi:NitT/TauT family transport system substrate-binding protein